LAILFDQRRLPLFTLRPMSEHDLNAVLQIEISAYFYPWTRGNFADSLAAHYGCIVLEHIDQIVGYAIVMNALDDLHLLNITVAPQAQGKGLSHQLMGWVESCAHTANCSGVLLEVRPSNRRALAIYEAQDFVQIGRRRDYYPHVDGREDAIVMRKLIRKPNYAIS
jgi:ribosomal-protein-alanine N-acetyltransferase